MDQVHLRLAIKGDKQSRDDSVDLVIFQNFRHGVDIGIVDGDDGDAILSLEGRIGL